MSLYKKIGFLGGYLLPILIILSYFISGTFWAFMPVVYTYILVPIIDEIVGKDVQNVQKDEFDILLKQKYFDFLVYSHVWIYIGTLVWTMYHLVFFEYTNLQIVGFIFSLGIYAATIINVAHELGHRNHSAAQLHAKIALSSVCYSHFRIEHNRGHHVHVATPQDPATSKFNQSLYSFWKQSLFGSFKSAWNIEKKLLIKQGLGVWNIKNEVLQGIFLSLFLVSSLFLVFSLYASFWSWIVLVIFFSQSIIAFLMLESINYIEHYGIVRNQLEDGRYEKVNPLHSWNANHFFSNLILFHLQRHSDHHAYASRPYQVLRHFDESPQLPFGYPVMILISLFPPLWFRTMNSRLENWQKKAYDKETIKNVVRQFA